MRNQDVNFYRLSFLAGGTLVPAFWFLARAALPTAIDPLVFRLGFAVVSFGLIGLSYFSQKIRTNIKFYFYVVLFMLVFWLGFLVWANNADPSYLTSQAIWFLVFTVYFTDLWSLLIYAVVALAVAALDMLLLKNPLFNPSLYLSLLSAGFLINIGSIFAREKIQKQLAGTSLELSKFQLVVENAGEHIIITDPNGRILYANKAVETITGYSRHEVLGQRPSVWGGQMPKAFYEDMWDTIKNKKERFASDVINKRKNGELYTAKMNITPILDDKGEVSFFVGIEVDITQEKQAQMALAGKVKELEELNSLMVGRELKMAELKKEIAKLQKSK